MTQKSKLERKKLHFIETGVEEVRGYIRRSKKVAREKAKAKEQRALAALERAKRYKNIKRSRATQ